MKSFLLISRTTLCWERWRDRERRKEREREGEGGRERGRERERVCEWSHTIDTIAFFALRFSLVFSLVMPDGRATYRACVF